MSNEQTMLSALAPNNPYYPYLLMYSPSINRFIDADWYVVHDISLIFDNWQLDKWKRSRRDAILSTKDGIEMKLYYLTDPEDEDILEFIGWNESYGIKMDMPFYKSTYDGGL